MYAVVMFLYTVCDCHGGCRGRIRGILVSGLKGSQYGKCFPTCTTERGDKEHCFFLRKNTLIILPTGLGKSLIFQLLPFVFDSWLGAKKSFILIML